MFVRRKIHINSRNRLRKGKGPAQGTQNPGDHGALGDTCGEGAPGGWREERLRSRTSQLPRCVTPVSNTLSVPCLE